MGGMVEDDIAVVTTNRTDFLKPLIVDPSELQAEQRRRRKVDDLRSVHPADVAELVQKGWTLRRDGKRKSQIGKPKSHDRAFEDRVWCLAFAMGFTSLNGQQFTIEFERANGSVGRKQIDVYAADDEAVLVVECKSREGRGRRSLQKDLTETQALQDYIRKAVYASYGERPKPKLIWVYATSNIIWSDSDVDRANDAKIAIVTENELQYFEAFLRHMGPAGKYQILAEFLKGQKIPGLDGMKVPAIQGKLGGQAFYSFVASPRYLLRIAFVNHQALNHPDGKPAYQRMISSKRIKEIGEYISGGGYFPTNILINFVSSPRFEPLTTRDDTSTDVRLGWLTLPQLYRSAWIIDGQHRLYGYSHLSNALLDENLFVLAFDRMNTRKEADLFITINHKQKSVPKGLLMSLLADLKLGDQDPKTAVSALASAVVRALNTDKTSPLSRRFATPGVPPEANQNLTISEAVNGLVRSDLVGRVVGRSRLAGPLCGATDDETITRARIILNSYFEQLRQANPSRWEAGRAAYVSTNPGIRAHLSLVAEIVRYLEHKNGLDFHALDEKKFATYVGELAKPVFEFVNAASDEEIAKRFSRKFGEGGLKEYLYNLFNLVHEGRTDFGPTEFLNWVAQSESDRVEDANRLVMLLSERLTNYVIDTLKAVHGVKTLPSGDPAFWEIGIESRRVKDNAYDKQQADSAERRKPREAYLDIVDLEDIVKQKNNWDHFEPVFRLPMPSEKAGQKYYLSWIARFNELRRIAAHKNSLRTYTEADLEFLDWLKGQLEDPLGLTASK